MLRWSKSTVPSPSYPDERETMQSFVIGFLFLSLPGPSHLDSCWKIKLHSLNVTSGILQRAYAMNVT